MRIVKISHSRKPMLELGLEELIEWLRVSFDEEDSDVNVNKPNFNAIFTRLSPPDTQPPLMPWSLLLALQPPRKAHCAEAYFAIAQGKNGEKEKKSSAAG